MILWGVLVYLVFALVAASWHLALAIGSALFFLLGLPLCLYDDYKTKKRLKEKYPELFKDW